MNRKMLFSIFSLASVAISTIPIAVNASEQLRTKPTRAEALQAAELASLKFQATSREAAVRIVGTVKESLSTGALVEAATAVEEKEKVSKAYIELIIAIGLLAEAAEAEQPEQFLAITKAAAGLSNSYYKI